MLSRIMVSAAASVKPYDCDGFVPAIEFLYCKLRTITHEFPMDDGPNAIVKGTFVYHPDGLPDYLVYPDYPIGYYFMFMITKED